MLTPKTNIHWLLLIVAGISILHSCKKDEEVRPPALETLEVTLISNAGATLNGNITDVGTSGVKEAGFLYGITSDLTFETSQKVAFGAVTKAGPITVASDDYFTPGQTFFVKAYALPADGSPAAYGAIVTFIGKGGVGLPPTITDFNPKEGPPGTVITIDGKNFDGDPSHIRVSFNDIQLEITQATLTKIVTKVPNEIQLNDFAASLKLEVREKSITSVPTFHLLAPVITDFNPKAAKTGQLVTIDGQNFSADVSKVNVTFLGKTLEVTQASTTKIVVKIPGDMNLTDTSGPFTIKVWQQFKTTVSSFHFLYPWKRLADFPADARYGAVSFVINGVGYVGLGEKNGGSNPLSGDVWKYDVVTDTWQGVKFYGPNPTGLYYLNQSAFVIGNKAYVGIGRSNDGASQTILSTFYSYDPSANTWSASRWTNGATFDGAVASSVNGKGYVLTGLGSGNKAMQYDASGDAWTPKSTAPMAGGNDRYKAATFTIGNDIYVTTGAGSGVSNLTNDLWMYSTVADTWTPKAALPSSARWQATGFAINDTGYLVGGGGQVDYSNEVWAYSPINNQWTKLVNYPGGNVLGSFAFVINGKAYFGTGATPGGGRRKDVWVFDPSLL